MEENFNEVTKKKGKAGLIVTIIILILLLIGALGYIAYDKGYLDKLLGKEEPVKEVKKEEPKEEVKSDKVMGFYSADNLVDKGYLIKITDTNSEYTKHGYLIKGIKIENGIVKILDRDDESDEQDYDTAYGISGTPKYVRAVNASETEDLYYVLTSEGDVYYLSTNHKSFKKVSDKNIVNIYKVNINNDSSIADKIYTEGVYGETENGELYEITGSGMNSKTLREVHPNLDK